MVTIGGTSFDAGLFVVFFTFGLGLLLNLAVMIWLIVLGFKVHWGWGLANLLFPIAMVVFCIVHFDKARRPLGVLFIGLTILVAINFLFWIFWGT